MVAILQGVSNQGPGYLARRKGLARILHRRTGGTLYGVPALAGQTRFRLGSPSASSRLPEAMPSRLKPGLHTPRQVHDGYRTVRSLRSEEHTSELQSLRHLVC